MVETTTFSLLTRQCLDKDSPAADKHKTKDYQMFKEGYVKKVTVKANVKAENLLFIVKCYVAAAMEKAKYLVYVHLCQRSG